MNEALKRAAERVGGVQELARRLNMSRQAVYQWTRVPSERVAQVAEVTGVPAATLRPDLFGKSNEGGLYDRDVFLWTMEQARLLREQKFEDLDLEHLVEEITDLGNSHKDEIESRLFVLLTHLLKWRHQPEHRNGSWRGTIHEQRARLARRIRKCPSLASYPSEVLDEEYREARGQAAAETGLPEGTFPEICPFTVEQVLDRQFLPD